MAKSNMPAFIQGMYGTVLGVSFYTLVKDRKDMPSQWAIAKSCHDVGAFFSNFVWWQFLHSEDFFKLCLFLLTLLITAHDWLSYHQQGTNREDKKFVYYIPDILCLFFIAQMFASVKDGNIKYWYAFGLGYTLCNMLSWLIEERRVLLDKNFYWKYPVHAIIAIAGWLWIPEKFAGYWLIITAVVVICLWAVKSKKHETEKSSSQEINSAVQNTLSDIRRCIGELKTDVNHIQTDLKKDIADTGAVLKKIGEQQEAIKTQIEQKDGSKTTGSLKTNGN